MEEMMPGSGLIPLRTRSVGWFIRASAILLMVVGISIVPLDTVTVTKAEACADPDSETVPELVAAAAAGDLARVRELVDSGAEINPTPPGPEDEGYVDVPLITPLQAAAGGGHLEIMAYLIEHGATISPEVVDAAVRSGRVETIRLLRKRGVTITDASGINRILYSGNLEMIRYLVEEEGIDTPLHDGNLLFPAVYAHNTELVAYLLEHGADTTVNRGAPSSASPLSDAAEYGYADIVELLVRAGIDPEEPANNGWTALMNAAAQGQLEAVQRLVALGADIHKVISPGERGGWTAVGLAASRGIGRGRLLGNQHDEVVKYLLDLGADINTRDPSGTTILMFAAERGDTRQVKELLARGAESNAISEAKGTALIQAVQENNREMAELLLQSGAKLDLVCPGPPNHPVGVYLIETLIEQGFHTWWGDEELVYGNALTMAAATKNREMIGFLVSQGAEPDSDVLAASIVVGDSELLHYLLELGGKNYLNGTTAGRLLVDAVCRKKMDIVRLLLDYGVDIRAGDDVLGSNAALQKALSMGDIGLATTLIEYGAEVNSRGARGQTPLMGAAELGDVGVVKLFAEKYGADINAKDNRGHTALMGAAIKGDRVIIAYLVGRGADMTATDSEGLTVLHYAVSWCDTGTVMALIADDTEVNSRDNKGQTPLIYAIRENRLETIKLLVENYDAETNYRDTQGRTPLMWAAANGCFSIVELLVDTYGAEINSRDATGSTPLMFAVSSGSLPTVKWLVEAGADTNARNDAGMTALALADQRRERWNSAREISDYLRSLGGAR